MPNSLLTISPYRQDGIWMFDDPRVGLAGEPFVAGMPEIIEEATRHIPNAARGFNLIFSTEPFPGADVELVWVRAEMDGNWYRWESRGLEGWLCPALYLYFPEAPRRLFCQALPRK